MSYINFKVLLVICLLLIFWFYIMYSHTLYWQSGNFEKLNKSVQFPEVLNMAPYMSGTKDKYPFYNLYAVVVHLDIMNAAFSGHYVCYVKNIQGEWFRTDDSRVRIYFQDKWWFDSFDYLALFFVHAWLFIWYDESYLLLSSIYEPDMSSWRINIKNTRARKSCFVL